MERIGIVGGGAWGTALAQAARRAGRTVTLWAREAEVVEAINARLKPFKRLPCPDDWRDLVDPRRKRHRRGGIALSATGCKYCAVSQGRGTTGP